MASFPVASFESTQVPKPLLGFSALLSLFYFTWWLDFSHAGAWALYGALLTGEIYHVWQSLAYIHTIWDQKPLRRETVGEYPPPVDVFITVCGEPVHIVEKTVEAALALNYPDFKVWVLNDGLVAKKENWRRIEELARRRGASVITRKTPGGAKAGNVNNALRLLPASTAGSHDPKRIGSELLNTPRPAPFFALFDADHVPHPEFLQRTMGYFRDEKMAFVQTPQYYKNKDKSFLTFSAWEQQELFFGPICQGKNRLNATFWCGTNAVIRKKAVHDIGGIPEDNIAEDFLASLFMHQKGWKSVFVPDILAEGLAPADLKSYWNQQFRWARGSLEVIFKYNPLFHRGLTWAQKSQYLYSAGYYLNGIIVLIDAIVPIAMLLTNTLPVQDTASNFIAYFFPFIFTTLYLLMRSTNYTITFRAIQLTMSSFFVFFLAAIAAVAGKKTPFHVTSKMEQEGNYLMYALPNILYALIGAAAIAYAVITRGVAPSVVTNSAWIIFNIVFFFPFIRHAYPWRSLAGGFEAARKLAGIRRLKLAPVPLPLPAEPVPSVNLSQESKKSEPGSVEIIDEHGRTRDN